MSRATRLANHLERTVTGPMWHGPALVDVLEGVDATRARTRPVAGAHSIWEIVLHVTAWADIARQRINGEALGDPAPEQDWPPVSDADADWPQAVERMNESHRRLAADTRLLDDAALDARVKGLDYPVGILLDGVVEHGTYHGGQIALLKKAWEPPLRVVSLHGPGRSSGAGSPRITRPSASCWSASTRKRRGSRASATRRPSTRRCATAGSTASRSAWTRRATRTASRRARPTASGAWSTRGASRN